MHILKRSLLFLGVTAFALTACKDDDPVEPEDTIAVTNISVSPPSVTILVGATIQVSASVATNGGTGTIDLGVNWSTSNSSVASVTTAGVVTAQNPGTASITATSKANAAYSASVAVTVNAPPQAPNALLAFSVTPSAVSIVSGGSAATSTIAQLSSGGSVSYASVSSNAARCTIDAGANPTITTLAAGGTGTCVITITATGSGTGLVTNSIAQAIAVTVTAQPVALTSLTVTPNVFNTVPGGMQVITTLTQSVVGAAVTFESISSNNAVATVTPAGANPTITAVGNGSAQITITATGSGTGLITNSISAVVQVNVQAASVSISQLTTCVGPAPCVVTPINLAGAFGQIEVELNISSGNQQIGSVAVFLGNPVAGSCDPLVVAYVEAARQIFGVNGAPDDPVTLNINTAEFDATFTPRWINGLNCVQAQLFPVAGPMPDASNTVQFTLVNPDVVYFNATVGTTASAAGLHHTGNSAVQAAGPANTWWKGGFTFRAHPVLYSGAANVVSIAYTSSTCGAVAGLAPTFVATFSCAGTEAAQVITNAVGDVTITYVAGYTLTPSPTGFMTAATPGFVPGNPVYAAVTTREDNIGPRTHTPLFINPGAVVGVGTWTGDGSAGAALFLPAAFQGAAAAAVPPTTYTVTATDFGVGGAVAGAGLSAVPSITEVTVNGTTFASGSSPAAIPLPETLVASGAGSYTNRGNAVDDLLGNVGVTTTTGGAVAACGGGVPAGSGSRCANTLAYGVDLIVLDARYADGSYASVPAPVANAALFSYVANNGKVFTTLGVAVPPAVLWTPIDGVTDLVFAEAIDTRSGLNNPNAFFQAVRRRAPGPIATNCYASIAGGDPLTVIQANSYVQNPLGAGSSAAMDCVFGAGVAGSGYYTWTGHIADRANNRKKIFRTGAGGTAIDSIWIAIDQALPNITGVGFQVALYVGGSPADYNFSANDDLELMQGQVSLSYTGGAFAACGAACASGTGVPFPGATGVVIYPYGSSGAGGFVTPSFGAPFDTPIVNVLNGTVLTLGYYIVRFDIATVAAFVPGAAPSGNVAGFTSSEIQDGVIANVRDVAFQQAALPIMAPILNTQIMDRTSIPGYGAMIDWRIMAKGATVVVRDAAPSALSVPFCDRVDIYEAVDDGVSAPAAGMTANDPTLGDGVGDGLRFRMSVTAAPVLTDNGFQRFFTYTSPSTALPVGLPAATGLFTAACVKSGSALLSPLF
jgi:hypothetical protein